MQRSNMNSLSRASMIACLVPLALFSVLLITGYQPSYYEWFSVVLVGAGFVIGYLYLLNKRLEDLTWQQQIQILLKQSNTPVLVTDNHHRVIYSNDSFSRSPLATLLTRFDNTIDLMNFFEKSNDDLVGYTKNTKLKATLDALCAKIKMQVNFCGSTYEWTMNPIVSTTGKRLGTLNECVLRKQTNEIELKRKEGLPLIEILDQLGIPFLYLDNQEQVTYVNLSLKMLLIRHQALVQGICPELNIYEPTTDALKQFMIMAQKEELSFSDFVKQGNILLALKDEHYQLTLQPLWNANNETIGTLVLWQEDISYQTKQALQKVNHQDILEKSIDHSFHPLIILDANSKIQHANQAMLKLLYENDSASPAAEWKNKDFIGVIHERSLLVAERMIQALNSKKMAVFVAEHQGKFYDWILTPMKEKEKIVGYVVEIRYPSHQEYRGFEESLQRQHDRRQYVEKDLTKFTRGIARLNLYQKEPDAVLNLFKPEEYHHPLLRNSAKIVHQIAGCLQKLYTEIESLKENLRVGLFSNKTTQFNQVAIEMEENKKKAEEVLLEGLNKQ